MNINHLSDAVVEWIMTIVFPSLDWTRKLSISIVMPAMIDEIKSKAQDILNAGRLIDDRGNIDAPCLLERIKTYMFADGDYIPVKIAGIEFKIRYDNVKEIVDNAVRRSAV